MVEVWISFYSNCLSYFTCISSISLLCNVRQLVLKLIPRVLRAFSSPGRLERKDASEILAIGCHLVEMITVGDGNSIGLKLAGKCRSSIWASKICAVMELRNTTHSTSF